MSFEYWLSFFFAALLINVTPVPDLLFILSRSNNSGKLTVFWGAAGLWVAALTHVSAVAVGISAIIFASEVMFTLIKYIGALYLIWLGIKLFLSKQNLLINHQVKEGRLKSFASGYIVNISNPKAALFFMAFLPMFIENNDAHPQVQMFILGVLVVLVKMLVELLLIFCSSYVSNYFSKNKCSSKIVSKISSIFFIGFGLQLLVLGR